MDFLLTLVPHMAALIIYSNVLNYSQTSLTSIAIFFEIRECVTKVIFITPSPPPMNMHRFMYILKIATPSPY